MKKFLSIILLAAVCASAVGCSYKQVDDAVKGGLTGESSEGPTVVQTQPQEGDIIYVEQGDSLPDSYETTVMGETVSDGVKGLSYTFDKATVYDSITDAEISTDECEVLHETDAETETMYKNNKFIVVDLTATYTNESGSSENDEINFYMGLKALSMWEDEYADSHNAFLAADESLLKTEPYVVYFSEHPVEGDTDLSGNELDPTESLYACRKSLKSGESLSFKVGIVAAEEFVDADNVFLCRYESQIGDEKLYYIDIFGSEKG